MLHPSYTDLMKVVNKDVEEGETKVVNSRYSIVMATSRRARQLIAGQLPLVNAKPGEKPLSIAIDEMSQGKLKIVAESEEEFALVEAAALEEAKAAKEAELARRAEEGSGETEDEAAEAAEPQADDEEIVSDQGEAEDADPEEGSEQE